VARWRKLSAAVLLGGLISIADVGTTSASAQEVRGLVIGINEHVELSTLRGAVNDARDIAYALAATGSDDIVVLEDAAATRERITAEWRALLARSSPGDTVVLTFAGHGGQEPARLSPGHELDGFDEVLLLSAFTSAEPGRIERIVDDELAEWFVEAGERELRVIFVADTSHSGGLHPDLDPYASSSECKTSASVPRAVEYARPAQYARPAHGAFPEDLLKPDALAQNGTSAAAILPHVSFLAATQEHDLVSEVVLPDDTERHEPRGALSYHFARALWGDADVDEDGMLRRGELWSYVCDSIGTSTEWRQQPHLVPGGDDTVLLRVAQQHESAP